MLHFVNQTKTDFVLKLTEDNFLCLCKKDSDSSLTAVQIDVGGQGQYDDLLVAVQEKLADTDNTFEIKANRSSKLYVSAQDISVLYSEKYAENSMIHMFAKETGLKASEYYFPKSAIFVITDDEKNKVNIKYADKETNDLAYGDDYASAPIYRAGSEAGTIPGIRVTVFLCNLSKWNKVPEDTFITISDELKLRIGTITKTNGSGNTYTINALIRCDGDGNEIQTHRKDAAGRHPGEGKKDHSSQSSAGGNGGSKKKGNKNKGKRTKRSEINKRVQTVSNGWDD